MPDDSRMTVKVSAALRADVEDGFGCEALWLELPMNPSELARALRDGLGIESLEEACVYETIWSGALAALSYTPGRGADLVEVDALAAAAARCDERALHAVGLYMSELTGDMCTPVAYANACMQADEIPYVPFGSDVGDLVDACRALGRDLASAYILDADERILPYGDFWLFGKAVSEGVTLYEEGYLVDDARMPGLDRFGAAEVFEALGVDDWQAAAADSDAAVLAAKSVGLRLSPYRATGEELAMVRLCVEGTPSHAPLDACDRAAVRALLDRKPDSSALQCANACLQVDAIPFFPYAVERDSAEALVETYGRSFLAEAGIDAVSEVLRSCVDTCRLAEEDATNPVDVYGYIDFSVDFDVDLERRGAGEILDECLARPEQEAARVAPSGREER